MDYRSYFEKITSWFTSGDAAIDYFDRMVRMDKCTELILFSSGKNY
jgi:hypothetical protein